MFLSRLQSDFQLLCDHARDFTTIHDVSMGCVVCVYQRGKDPSSGLIDPSHRLSALAPPEVPFSVAAKKQLVFVNHLRPGDWGGPASRTALAVSELTLLLSTLGYQKTSEPSPTTPATKVVTLSVNGLSVVEGDCVHQVSITTADELRAFVRQHYRDHRRRLVQFSDVSGGPKKLKDIFL